MFGSVKGTKLTISKNKDDIIGLRTRCTKQDALKVLGKLGTGFKAGSTGGAKVWLLHHTSGHKVLSHPVHILPASEGLT